MGMEPYQLSSSLIGLMAQRLVRTLCPHCKASYDPSRNERHQLGIHDDRGITLCKPVGCPQCRHTGFIGRSGIHELIEVDRNLE
ncbi:type II secretion system protein GspE, partial [Acinetobacter baumannii]